MVDVVAACLELIVGRGCHLPCSALSVDPDRTSRDTSRDLWVFHDNCGLLDMWLLQARRNHSVPVSKDRFVDDVFTDVQSMGQDVV